MKLLVGAIGFLVLAVGSMAAMAQDLTLPGFPGVGSSDPSYEHSGAGVFHGNYCGLGDRGPGLPPVDALDRACMHHDACTPRGGVPTCACNARFKRETHAVAVSSRQTDDLRSLATAVEAGIALIPCN